MNEFNFEAAIGPQSFRIFLDRNLLDYAGPLEPARKHKKKRIAKKWLKRYGYRLRPDPHVYICEGNRIIMHPAIFKKFERAIGSPEKAAEEIIKAISKEE